MQLILCGAKVGGLGIGKWVLGIGYWVLSKGIYSKQEGLEALKPLIISGKTKAMEQQKSLENLDIFRDAIEIGEYVWNLVDGWNSFARSTIGEQFVDAADSISANIAEGYGRYFYKERRKFYYYGRGSLLETKYWAIKSVNRKLITNTEYEHLLMLLLQLHHKLNSYIKMISRHINNNRTDE